MYQIVSLEIYVGYDELQRLDPEWAELRVQQEPYVPSYMLLGK